MRGCIIFFPSTLTDCLFVSLAVTQFVAGIKACREAQDLIGNLGEVERKCVVFCSVVLMCLNTGLSFPCPQSTYTIKFQLNAPLLYIISLSSGMEFLSLSM